MSESLFSEISDLDTAYLNEAYANDAETACLVFEQYLEELPSNLKLLTDSFRGQDIERFRHHIHKQKPGFSYVGLTDVTHTLQELQLKCEKTEDLINYQDEIEAVLSRINSSAGQIAQTLAYLKNINHH